MRLSLLVALALISCATSACAGSYRTRILIPLEGRADRLDCEQCDRECRYGHGDGDLEYLRCLVTCPGAQVAHNTVCGDDQLPPRAVCRVTDMNLEARAAAKAAKNDGSGAWVGSLLGAIALSALGAATKSKTSDSDSSESEPESVGGKTATRTGMPPGPRPSSKPNSSDSKKPAEPKPAEPSRGK